MFTPDKYLSAKWLKGGRVFPEIDCFGLINEIRIDLSLPKWPEFAGITKDDNGLDSEAKKFMTTLTRCEPEVGAGIACFAGRLVTHVGIVVLIDDQLCIAECNPRRNVTFMPLSRLKGLYHRVEYWK